MMIEIRDSGVGISNQAWENLFHAFERGDENT